MIPEEESLDRWLHADEVAFIKSVLDEEVPFIKKVLDDWMGRTSKQRKAASKDGSEGKGTNQRAEIRRQLSLIRNMYFASLGVPVLYEQGAQLLAVHGVVDRYFRQVERPSPYDGDDEHDKPWYTMLRGLGRVDLAFKKHVEISEDDWTYLQNEKRTAVQFTVRLVRIFGACNATSRSDEAFLKKRLNEARRRASKVRWGT
jgi:hypothetical protein